MPCIDGFAGTLGGPQADEDVDLALPLTVKGVVTMPEVGGPCRTEPASDPGWRCLHSPSLLSAEPLVEVIS